MPPKINTGHVPKTLLLLNVIVSLIYISWWFNPSNIGQPVLYGLLLFGELYHVIMSLTFWYTIWPSIRRPIQTSTLLYQPSVDIFITVAGEPTSIVKKTANAARNLNYPYHQVYLLNDGFVAKKDNWMEIEQLAKNLNIHCITRKRAGGAKAGNVNHALRRTKGQIVVIFDADMIPNPEFLTETIQYFSDPQVGFVQTPQYYSNHSQNLITQASWKQQEFFFGPILIGKQKSNSVFICGTNVAIRRLALNQVDGLCEDNIAEDFITSLLIHAKKWKSVYLPQVLAQGLAPQDLLSYYKQQLRWARGSLEVLFKFNPFFKRGLSFKQKIEYLSSALYYANGLIVLIDVLMPIQFFFTNASPVNISTTVFAFYFIPFMFLNLLTISKISNQSLNFQAISFSISSWTLQLQALWSILTNQKMSFTVTPKHEQQGNFLFLVYPHLFYFLITILGMAYSWISNGLTNAFFTNSAWALLNIVLFLPFIKAAYPWSNLLPRFTIQSQPKQA